VVKGGDNMTENEEITITCPDCNKVIVIIKGQMEIKAEPIIIK